MSEVRWMTPFAVEEQQLTLIDAWGSSPLRLSQEEGSSVQPLTSHLIHHDLYLMVAEEKWNADRHVNQDLYLLLQLLYHNKLE